MSGRIYPGKKWTDTEGKPIQAHGGSVYFENGTYYWIGENKERTDGKNGIWQYGMRAYASEDLSAWRDLGLIVPPSEDRSSTLHPFRMADRPHILYNAGTKKYVLWIKVMDEAAGTQSMTILTADSLLGPYETVRERYRPLGMNAGDFDLSKAEDGKGYIYFERVHSELICADLTEDYCGVTGYYSTHFPRVSPPYVREAPAHFSRNGKHYLITSGTTGYLPNPSECAAADTWHGPFRVLGNPHPGDATQTSYRSQISCVFRAEGKKDLFIAAADRWAPDVTADYAVYGKLYERLLKGDIDAYFSLLSYGEDKKRATRDADYVWLPVRFDGDVPVIEWKEEWGLDDYE